MIVKETKVCPYCGKETKNLTAHLRFCKAVPEDKKVEETPKEYVEEEITVDEAKSDDPREEVMLSLSEYEDWKDKLDVFLQKPAAVFRIVLGRPLGSETMMFNQNDYQFSTDDFLCIVRNHCEKFEISEDGKTFMCYKSN